MTAKQRHEAAQTIASRLDEHCIRHKPTLVGLYWPIKYEPNLLAWARRGTGNLQFCRSSSRVDNR
jgi:5-formyltetrahydrofolate cyclo-ligase